MCVTLVQRLMLLLALLLSIGEMRLCLQLLRPKIRFWAQPDLSNLAPTFFKFDMDYTEQVRHAKNWLIKMLWNYWTEDAGQLVRPAQEAMRVAQYFRMYIDDGCVLVLYKRFGHSPDFFQVFLFQFWKLYFDVQSNNWACRNPSACAVHLTRWFWWNFKAHKWNPTSSPCISFDIFFEDEIAFVNVDRGRIQ